jgi:GNAT superfamily N-acetyltransferase
MSIRAATPDDATAIATMLARLADETGDGARFASTPDTIRAYGFGPEAYFHTLIAERDGAPAGLALYFRHFSTTRAQPGVYVQDLWVAPEARGAHLGARLLAAVAAAARAAWGARYLALTTHGANHPARAFYTRLGFEPQGDTPMMLDGGAFASLSAHPEAA